jgi:hypothetical protein
MLEALEFYEFSCAEESSFHNEYRKQALEGNRLPYTVPCQVSSSLQAPLRASSAVTDRTLTHPVRVSHRLF